MECWKRAPYYNHFFNQLRCTYSITVDLDITAILSYIKETNRQLYPTLIYAITKIVNSREEFRTSTNAQGEVGIWDELRPNYTIFHKADETFSTIWTEWNDDPEIFMKNYSNDLQLYGELCDLVSKPDTPANTFPISCLPWTTFTGFNLNIFADGSYLLPIFTLGKYHKENGTILIPLSVQVHHAVCDGFHVSRFINELQELLTDLPAHLTKVH